MRPRRFKKVSTLERLFAGHHDVLAALRSLRRSPGFVAIAVLSLGLAIAVYTTTFALLDAIRRPYVAYRDPGQLYTLEFGGQPLRDFLSIEREMYLAVRPRHDLFAAMAPISSIPGGVVIEADGELVDGNGTLMGTNLFDVLGVKPLLGRTFDTARDEPTDANAVIVSYQLWHEHLGENRDLSQLKVAINDRDYSVIGVMPPGVDIGGDVWLPMSKAMERTGQGMGLVRAVVRLKPGDVRARVKAQLKALSAQFTEAHRAAGWVTDYRMDSMAPTAGAVGGFPLAVGLITTLVLLVACLNLANLMLARGLSRRRELAMRMAVGASRGAIARHVLTECGLLVVLGGGWGLLLSTWGVKLAESHMPSHIADLGLVPPRLDWRVVAFGIAVTAATVIVAGILPAMHAMRTNVNEAMKEGGAGNIGHHSRSYRLVVVCEIALALFVTMGSSFALQIARRVGDFRFSFDAAHVISADVYPLWHGCPASDSLANLWKGIVHAAEAVPGVRYAAMDMRVIPKQSTLTSDEPGAPIEIILGEGMLLGYDLVSPDYFRVLGDPIIAGRDFEPGDEQGNGAAILNRRTAARLWPLQSPVGRLLKLGPAASDAPWVPVVGIVGPRPTAAGDSTVDRTPDLTVAGQPRCKASQIYARASGDPQGPAVALYRAVRTSVPVGMAVTAFDSPKTAFEQNLRVTRLVAFLFSAFGVFTLLLSGVGVYGVLNYAVGQRIREFAMRSALGAQAADLGRIVLKDAMEMVLGGTALGATTALIIGGHDLAGMGEIGAITLASGEAVVILASLAACIGPIRRAVEADPAELLRAT